MSNDSELFGRLLKAGIGSIAYCEGVNAPFIEEELGMKIGVSKATIQRYKTGHIPRNSRAIEILARACVERGLMGRRWLEKFLKEARYPFHDYGRLVNELMTSEQLAATSMSTGLELRTKRVGILLPTPTYSSFVERPQAFAEIVEGLQQQNAAIVIVGMGGTGKTSLALEIAKRTQQDSSGLPRFDGAVWVTDKDKPGTTNLSTVLDTIARTFDYAGWTKFPYQDKLLEIEELLRSRKVLLVIDNAETITDVALFEWLICLPEPSKAIITSRELNYDYRKSCWMVDLTGMRHDEVSRFIKQQLRRLQMTTIATVQSQFDPMLEATGSNPKAIEMTLRLIKDKNRPLQDVVAELRVAKGDVFDELFTQIWIRLDEAAQHVLMAMTCFSSYPGDEIIRSIVDLMNPAFERSKERLIEFALLDIQRSDINNQGSYEIHPLVRAFAKSKLQERPSLGIAFHDRIIHLAVGLADVRFHNMLEDPQTLELLNAELGLLYPELNQFDRDHEVCYLAANEAFNAEDYSRAFQIARPLEYYYYLRGFWDKKEQVNLIYMNSAHALGYIREEIRMIAFHVILLSKQGRVEEAKTYLDRLPASLPPEIMTSDINYCIQHARASHAYAQQDWVTAQEAFAASLESMDILSNAHIIHRLWLGICLYNTGSLEEARSLLVLTAAEARQRKYPRVYLFAQCYLIAIFIQNNDRDAAAASIELVKNEALWSNDREIIATLKHLDARFHILNNDVCSARSSLVEAISLFSQLGMRHELAAARNELATLYETEDSNLK